MPVSALFSFVPGGTGIRDTHIGIILIHAWWYWNTRYLYRAYSHLCLAVLEFGIPISALFSFMPGGTGIRDTYIGILVYAWWYWNTRYLYRHYSRLCMVVLEYAIPISALFSIMPSGTGIRDTYIGIILIYAWWYWNTDRLCGLVVRVLGYRSGGPGSIPGTTRFSEK
jgi:hypothetical protein